VTNHEKNELRYLAKQGYSFEEIRSMISYAANSTIKNYLKIFTKKRKK
jgi:hypothetical protein